MKAGIVILNYNRGRLVEEICNTFTTYNCIHKIVVVDGYSSDDSLQYIRRLKSGKIHIIEENFNGGYAKGNNVGLRALRNEFNCDIGFVVTPDVFFEEKTVSEIIKCFDENRDYAVLSCYRFDPDDHKESLQYLKKSNNTFLLQLGWYLNIFRHFYILKRVAVFATDRDSMKLIEVAQVPGSFFGLNLALAEKFEYLDENIFLYSEEEILEERVKSIGKKEGFLPWVSYEHRHIRYSTTNNENMSLTGYGIVLKDKRYYQENYCGFNRFQMYFIRLAEKISILERKCILMWRKKIVKR